MLKLNKESLSSVKYKFYATLLDAFQWYLDSDDDDSFQEFIDKLNRVPFVSEAAEKGTAFNKLVDQIKNRQLAPVTPLGDPLMFPVIHPLPTPVVVSHKGIITVKSEKGDFLFEFKWPVVKHFVDMFLDADDQVYVEAILPTSKGDVLLYGYIDEVLPPGIICDIKTGKSYDFPKFNGNWQHLVYPYCFNAHDIPASLFRYDFTDFSNHYREDYQFQARRDTQKLVTQCERLISFIESQRDKIYDKKLFALDPPVVEELLTESIAE